MNEIPEDDLDHARAALAPTLEATAAILPWLAKPPAERFDKKLNQRWITACGALAAAWADRHDAPENIRPAIFALYETALRTGDAHCLALGEALASAADRLDDAAPTPHLLAALSATVEVLNDPAGLEHEAFGERAQHFAQRLEQSSRVADPAPRSALIDRLFIDEANEHLAFLHEALEVLPPDAYALTEESLKLAQQAELLELWGIRHLARQVADIVQRHAEELDSDDVHGELAHLLDQLAAALAGIED